MPIPWIPLAIGAGSSLGKLFTRTPKYSPYEYKFELAPKAREFLDTMSTAERGELSRFFTNLGRARTERLASQGVYGVSPRQALETGMAGERSEALSGLLSKQAQRALSMIDTLNRFGREEHRAGYESRVGRAGELQNIIDSLGGYGMAGYMGMKDEELLRELLEKYVGSSNTGYTSSPTSIGTSIPRSYNTMPWFLGNSMIPG